jgi:hypothetical protein
MLAHTSLFTVKRRDNVTGLIIGNDFFFEGKTYSNLPIPASAFAFLGVPAEGPVSVDVTPRSLTFKFFGNDESDPVSKVAIKGRAKSTRTFSNRENLVSDFRVRSIAGGIYFRGEISSLNIESITGASLRALRFGEAVDPRRLLTQLENPKIIVPGSLFTWGSGPPPFNSGVARGKALGAFLGDFQPGWWNELVM